jgi:hypothetical protein
MIGVLSEPAQTAVVEEFFELFKTPWEFYTPGRVYDVVIVTARDVPPVDSSLVIISSPDTNPTDSGHGFVPRARRRGVSLRHGGTEVPLYGEALLFESPVSGTARVESTCGIAAIQRRSRGSTVIRLGYDLFREVEVLLANGQPVEQASVPTLDLHISMLREWILDDGVPLIEVPPVPGGHEFAVCLTHDVDFVGIRRHRFDHTMWGFLYRSTAGAARNLIRRRISIGRLLKTWRAAATLPLVHLGWAKDFWEPFDWYLRVERGLPATYFLIPFKRRSGERVVGSAASRRASAYDIGDVPSAAGALIDAGCEIGVHAIDAWHSVEKGRDELARIAAVTGDTDVGVRTHWLLRDERTPRVMDEAGFAYDSGAGYNETVGFRNGTAQVFRPLGARRLLELPLHVQDGALFYPRRLDLSEPEAAAKCDALIGWTRRLGGVLTVLWHDRSHAPERFWGGFYVGLLERLRSRTPWFGTAGQIVDWYRRRRAIRFARADELTRGRVDVSSDGGFLQPPAVVRFHRPASAGAPATFTDISWDGTSPMTVDPIEFRPLAHQAALTCAVQ